VNHFKLTKLPLVVCLATIVFLGGCHKKVAATPPPPPPPPQPAPTASITVTPSAINYGQSATLQWTTTNAASASISGIGTVATSGSQAVYPASSITYTLTAKGDGGSVDASTRITVNLPPPPPAPAPAPPSLTEDQLFEQNIHDVYFDYDKADLRPQDSTVVEQDAAFLVKHPDIKLVIEGHCDERGSAEYNIALGQRRAVSLQEALVTDGVAASRIRVISYGKEKPFCTESNEQCWQQNRRDHLGIDR
jgi:peptidoglycan-associated lipoprotein